MKDGSLGVAPSFNEDIKAVLKLLFSKRMRPIVP
jgi:hypothetical protein